jgi:hypothetical protein
MDDALLAYDSGRSDGIAGESDAARAGHPETGADYRVGVLDGQLAAFEAGLIAAVRKALGSGQISAGPEAPGQNGKSEDGDGAR